MVNANAARALHATPIAEDFDLAGATAHGGAGPFLDYALGVRRVGGLASARFDDLKAPNALYSGGFDVTLLVLLRPLGFIRPQDFGAVTLDPYVSTKIGTPRLPDPTTVHRSLHRLEPEEARAQVRGLHRDILRPALLTDKEHPYVILDGDSTVEVCYGEHVEGAEVGYNPRAHGRRSYHPLLFTDGVRDLVLDAWLRPGNASDKTDLLDHYRDTRDWLAGIGRPVEYARFDRGFCGEDIYSELERDRVGYAIKSKLTRRIKDALQGATFREITCEGDASQIEVTEVEVKLSGWSRTRRVVVVRLRERDPDQLWLGDWGWRYEAVVTSLDWAPEDVWRFYNRRCQAENVIKELKEGYGIDKLSTGSFGANDADLVLKVISYNLVWSFRNEVLPPEWRPLTIRTLRTHLLRIPGVLMSHARQLRLRLASWYAHVERFAGIRARVAALVT